MKNKKKSGNVLDETSKQNVLKTHVKAVEFTSSNKIRRKKYN